jgi:hypothetical protein
MPAATCVIRSVRALARSTPALTLQCSQSSSTLAQVRSVRRRQRKQRQFECVPPPGAETWRRGTRAGRGGRAGELETLRLCVARLSSCVVAAVKLPCPRLVSIDISHTPFTMSTGFCPEPEPSHAEHVLLEN